MKIPKFKSNPLFLVLSKISLKNKIVTFYLGRSIPKHVINMYIFLATSVPKCRFSLQYFYLPKLCTTCFVPTIYVHTYQVQFFFKKWNFKVKTMHVLYECTMGLLYNQKYKSSSCKAVHFLNHKYSTTFLAKVLKIIMV